MNKKLKVSLLIILIVIMNVILLNSHCVMANSNVEGYIADDNEFQEFISTLEGRSIHKFNVDVTENDSILTLSTCGINNKYRTVLHAIKSE